MNGQVSVMDVAAYILDRRGRMSTWKLQKLCYYSQAWALVWDDAPLFGERIEAWANGPAVPDLYAHHRGRFYIAAAKKGNASRLDVDQRETVDAVLDFYGGKSAAWLSGLTLKERPWREARHRENLTMGERGSAVIPLDSMAEYYGGLHSAEEA